MRISKLLLQSVVYLLVSAGITFAADAAVKIKMPVIEVVAVKGGCYQMGNALGDGEKNETPAHEVCVKDFNLGKYEVTQEQWQLVMGDNPSEFKQCGNNCPVDSVSWDMVTEFITKLNAMTKKKYRLPTEAEWEYAARSGGKNEKWPGTVSAEQLKEYAWYSENSKDTTHPVGKKTPNGLGLYDMAGNVREWCQDWYDEEYYAKSPKDNPKSAVAFKKAEYESPDRVQRGGGWSDDSMLCRAAFRHHNNPDFIGTAAGLRLVLP